MQRWGATRAPYRVCGRQCQVYCLFRLSPGVLYCLLETKALNPGVWGRAPVLLSFRIIYRKRIDSCLQILVILLWRQLQKIPLIAVIVVIVNPVINFCDNILEDDTSSNCFADFVLHMSEEAFLGSVVPTVATSGHRLNEFFVFQFLNEGITGVMGSLITIMPNSG